MFTFFFFFQKVDLTILRPNSNIKSCYINRFIVNFLNISKSYYLAFSKSTKLNQNPKIKQIEQDLNNQDVQTNPEEIIQYIKDNMDQFSQLVDILFSATSSHFYINQDKKKAVINSILRNHKELRRSFVKNILNCQTISDSNYYYAYQIDCLVNSIKREESITYEELSDIFEKDVNRPYSMVANIVLYCLRSDLYPINPNIYIEFDQYLDRLKAIIEAHRKSCYVPSVLHRDSNNPRVSKFGGVPPYLPANGVNTCICGAKMDLCFSIYVPSLPDEVKQLFPSTHEYVIVGYACNSCYCVQKVDLFVDDEIDQLVYDDVPFELFNEPRTITGYRHEYSYPQSISDGLEVTLISQQYKQPDLYFIDKLLEEEDNFRTYFLGYPVFIQGDDSPNGYSLFLEMEESEQSTNCWGDCGTCQVWMTTGDKFGDFCMQYACS